MHTHNRALQWPKLALIYAQLLTPSICLMTCVSVCVCVRTCVCVSLVTPCERGTHTKSGHLPNQINRGISSPFAAAASLSVFT